MDVQRIDVIGRLFVAMEKLLLNSAAHWHEPYAFEAAMPLFIEHWPSAWRAVSPAFRVLPLSLVEMQALAAQISGYADWFPAVSPSPLFPLANRIQAAIDALGAPCMVRLGSRSAKDSLYAHRYGLKIESADQAMACLLSGSERCAADLRMALARRQPMSLVVRRWEVFAACEEIRCFVVNRRVVAATEFTSLPELTPMRNAAQAQVLANQLATALAPLVAASPVNDAVFDLICPLGVAQREVPRLLDVNPLLAVTDRGLFAANEDFAGFLRLRTPEGIADYPLATYESVVHAAHEAPIRDVFQLPSST